MHTDSSEDQSGVIVKVVHNGSAELELSFYLFSFLVDAKYLFVSAQGVALAEFTKCSAITEMDHVCCSYLCVFMRTSLFSEDYLKYVSCE